MLIIGIKWEIKGRELLTKLKIRIGGWRKKSKSYVKNAIKVRLSLIRNNKKDCICNKLINIIWGK
jgi:hypothetical protein